MPRALISASFGSSVWLVLLVQSLVSSSVTDKKPVSGGGGRRAGFLERTLILLDVHTRSPVKVLNENFLSLQLDPAIISDGWVDFLSSKRLVTLARGLSPAVVRFGGKRTDFLRFENLKSKTRGPGPDYYLKNYEDDIVRSDIALDKMKGCRVASHPPMMLELQREKAAQMHQVLLKEQQDNIYSQTTITARSLDKLYNFADCAGLHLLFGLNALQRHAAPFWNGSNALSLLKYSASKKYNMSWELGNEPNGYGDLGVRGVNGSVLAEDHQQLRRLLQSVRFYSRSALYGPNTGLPRKTHMPTLDGFLRAGGSMVDVVTWQQ
ncbi:inactive heparanase-2 [Engraulis encrasicolus]|uniref:inactive heparanase-2 n=1 Tax=Engraulis encrasicolus TaxID=184585 RepID=UPI002FCF7DDE